MDDKDVIAKQAAEIMELREQLAEALEEYDKLYDGPAERQFKPPYPLAPCPFCGGEARLIQIENDGYYIECSNPLCDLKYGHLGEWSLGSLIEGWNRPELLKDLHDEVNWLHAELHGAELDADYMREGSKARQAYLMGVEDGREEGEAVGFMNGTDEISKLEDKINTLQSCLSDAAENDRLTTHEFNQLKEERDKLWALVRCLVYSENPSERAALINNAMQEHPSEEYAALWWNTRAQGICHPEEQYLDSHSDLTVTVCSECGVPTDDLEDCNYCPNCGRKVVE